MSCLMFGAFRGSGRSGSTRADATSRSPARGWRRSRRRRSGRARAPRRAAPRAPRRACASLSASDCSSSTVHGAARAAGAGAGSACGTSSSEKRVHHLEAGEPRAEPRAAPAPAAPIAASSVGRLASAVSMAAGRGCSFSVAAVMIAERAFAADQQVAQVVAGVVLAQARQAVPDAPVGGDRPRARGTARARCRSAGPACRRRWWRGCRRSCSCLRRPGSARTAARASAAACCTALQHAAGLDRRASGSPRRRCGCGSAAPSRAAPGGRCRRARSRRRARCCRPGRRWSCRARRQAATTAATSAVEPGRTTASARPRKRLRQSTSQARESPSTSTWAAPTTARRRSSRLTSRRGHGGRRRWRDAAAPGRGGAGDEQDERRAAPRAPRARRRGRARWSRAPRLRRRRARPAGSASDRCRAASRQQPGQRQQQRQHLDRQGAAAGRREPQLPGQAEHDERQVAPSASARVQAIGGGRAPGRRSSLLMMPAMTA